MDALQGNAPQSKDLYGKTDVIRSTTKEDLLRFHRRGYHPNNVDLFLAGTIPIDIEQRVRNYFDEFKRGHSEKKELPELPPLTKQHIFEYHEPSLLNADTPEESPAQVSMTWVVPTVTSKDTLGLYVLAHILYTSGGRLPHRIREQEGISYGINGGYSTDHMIGQYNIGGDIKANRLEDGLRIIFEEMNTLKSVPVTKKELDNVKTRSKYELAKSLGSNDGQIRAMLGKRYLDRTPQQIIKQIDAITPEYLQKLARQHLPARDGNYMLVINTPFK